jgi:hypothetical protein
MMRFSGAQRRRVLSLISLSVAALASGCGPKFGAFLYFSGLGQDQKTPAEFQLPKKPLLILVDDDYDLIHPPIARDVLAEALAKELRDHELADKITSSEELAKLRQVTPEFEKRCADTVGRLAHAEVVLWLQVVRFTIPDDIDAALVPCYFGVTVKVLDAKATKREDVRLWPKEREGKTIEVKISPHDLQQCKSIREAHTLVAQTLAMDVAKLFYEYETEQGPK